MKRLQIKTICINCNKEYSKDKSEYDRNIRLGRNSFCNAGCTRSYGNKQKAIVDNDYGIYELPYNIVAGLNNLLRDSIKRASSKKGRRAIENSLTLSDLVKLWRNQKECVYSKVALELQWSKEKTIDHRYRASLDRIDSSIGYHIDNIQFTSTSINFMKNKLTHKETIELIQLIKDS
tara:strand:+ start:1957 stop:2487 length:531 start_codon:yes stop_codon:yes gene_type:complete